MRKARKIIAYAAMLSTLAGIFAGCGSSDKKTGQSSGASDAPQKIVELTQIAWDRGTVPPDQGNIEENWWTKYVNEKGAKIGVKIKWIPIPRAQEAQKMATMLAASEAPDICATRDITLLNTYIKNNALVDFTDLYEKYGSNIKKLYRPQDIDVGRFNKKIYTFVHKTPNYADATWIRKDWLDKLGLKEPQSINEFYDVIKQFEEKDPGKVGDKLVPFAMEGVALQPTFYESSSLYGWATSVLPAFVKDAPTMERIVTPPQLWPESKDAMRFLNKLYNEKLLGEFILDKDGNLFKQKVIRGEVGAFIAYGHWPYHSAYGGIYDKLQQNIPDAKLIPAFPWKDKSQENFIMFFRGTEYAYRFFSPKTTKYPELVMKYIDWMASPEGYMVANLGIESTDYTTVNGVPKPVDQAKYTSRVPWIEPQYLAFTKPFSDDYPTYLKNLAKDFPEKYRDEFVKQTLTGEKIKYAFPVLNVPTPVFDKQSPILGKKWEEALAKMLVAPEKDFEKIFDDAVKSFKAEGGDDIAKEAVEAYKQTYGK